MSVVYFNVPGSFGGGGPSVWVAKTAQALSKSGHKIIYDKPNRANACVAVIETGKILKKINRSKTKVVLRIDGIYCREYWHGGPGRQWRSDMSSLHRKLKIDIPSVDHVVYQSKWSKDRIDSEIVKRVGKWSIIHNGVDIDLFKPVSKKSDGTIRLFHMGKIRNDYIMRSLIGTFCELKSRGHNVELIISGSMDGECKNVYHNYMKKNNDPNIHYMGPCSNTVSNQMFVQGDIYLGPRMGSSCDNVVVEALACGLPCVIPKWGGNSELITHGKEGVIVDGGKWDYDEQYIQNLADGVEQIIPDLQGYKVRARKHAINHLSIDTMVNRYLQAMGI